MKQMKAVVDRIEGNKIVLINYAGQTIELVVGQFPIALHEGDVVKLRFRRGILVNIALDVQSRQSLEKRIAKKLALIRKGKHLDLP
jgi:hypothetical protein